MLIRKNVLFAALTLGAGVGFCLPGLAASAQIDAPTTLKPETPAEPAKPAEPGEPGEPATPAEPAKPAQPDKPDKPDKPEKDE